MLLTVLPPTACSSCSLIQPRTTSLGVAPPKVGRTLPHPSLIKKRSPQMCLHVLLIKAIPPLRVLPSSKLGDLVCVKLRKSNQCQPSGDKSHGPCHCLPRLGLLCPVFNQLVLQLAAQCGFLKGHGLSAATQVDVGTGCGFSWPGDLKGFAYLTLG